ncbi:MAG TPA: sensory rhodopsin transducer [Armatimonadota bacterium]|jgi:hypothetical protein|nr:sensory rhodopsin transducer [Armatimonadota bacterium]
MAQGHGHKLWIIPDGYIATTPPDAVGPSGYVTHESVCILNDGDEPAQCTLDVYFEDRDPMLGIPFTVGAQRSLHLRLDKLKTPSGEEIPRDTCYSLRVTSDRNIVVQHSRLDVTQSNATLFTTMAFPVE